MNTIYEVYVDTPTMKYLHQLTVDDGNFDLGLLAGAKLVIDALSEGNGNKIKAIKDIIDSLPKEENV